MKNFGPTEKEIENLILEYLQARKIFIFKVEQMGTFDSAKKSYRTNHSPFKMSGISDLLGQHKTGLAIEVKTPGGMNRVRLAIKSYRKHGYITKNYKHEMEQLSFIREYRKRGGIAFFTCSLKHTIKTLKKHGVLI